MHTIPTKLAVLAFAAFVTISVAAGPAIGTHEADKPVETQYSFRVDLGDEVYGAENVHKPGKENGSIILYITGKNVTIEEPFHLGYLVAYSPLDTTECAVSDITAGGIDRGNDDQYTKTDNSLVGDYEGIGNRSSHNSDLGPEDDPGRIAPDAHDFRQKTWINFWDEGDFGGEPVTFNPGDEGIIAQKGCVIGPDEPGWYRGWGKVNGTYVNSGEKFRGTAFSNWNYVCNCDSYDAAVDQLGPPPEGYTAERGATSGERSTGESTPTSTPGATPTATATPTSTEQASSQETPESTATATSTPTSTATQTATATPTATTTQTTTATATQPSGEGGGDGSTGSSQPGFGALGTLVALAGAVLLGRRL